jgi:UDP-N-acetylglucosamine--N-acetylmuramyl-(pentapeptide) pyrophosphoryl-undecaprenol N-acetylglucosamine transferase
VNVVIAGGGTAGHVFPALAVADALRERHGASVTFLGSADGPEARLVPAAGYPFRALRVASAQQRLSIRSIRAIRMAFAAARACRPTIESADVILGAGGYASAPAALAARRARRPLVLLSPDSVPGAVTRIAARWSTAIATTFEATRARLPAGVRVERTGNPIRPAIASVPERRAEIAKEALAAFDLEEGRRTVLVLGGSQGSLRLDELTRDVVAILAGIVDLQLLLSCGPAHEATFRDLARSEPLLVRVVGSIERMELALALGDLAVARAGAGQIAELTACAVPSILVPYPHATELHQDANAREIERARAAVVLPEPSLTAEALAARIMELMDDEGARQAMSDAARAWSRPDAAARVSDLVAEVATGPDR